MSCRAALVGLVGLVALVVVAGACKGKPTPPVATLAEGQGAVSCEHAGKEAAAPLGQPFVLGDAARTGAGAWARLQLRGGPVLRLGADSLVRFVAAGTRLERGEAGAEAQEVRLITEAGPAIIAPGGTVRASSTAAGVRFEVTVGRAVIQRDDGAVTLDPGGHLTVAIGGAIVEKTEAAAAAPPPPTPPPPTPPPAAAAALAVTVGGKGVTASTGGAPGRPLATGGALADGDVIKVPKKASITITRGDATATAVGPAELTVGGADGALVTPTAGTTTVAAKGADVRVALPGGAMIATVDTVAAITPGRAESVARVERGAVTVDGDVSDASAAAGETGVLARTGEATVRDPAPTTVDVEVAAGEGATVHDPGKKVAVQLDFARLCGGPGTVELADGKGSFKTPRKTGGKERARFFATGGVTRYRVRCDSGDTKAGSVRVAGDTGAAAVVRTPPQNILEADGHKYGVSYQNRIPQIVIGWSEAKGASTLKLQPAKGAPQSFTSPTGTHTLAPGTLPEGSYTFYVVSGNRTSPPSTLRIDFDNAAPTAQITAPPPRADWSDPVVVTGVTAEGWKVLVDGKAPDLDGSGRFRAAVPTAGKDVIAIRLAHPEHGVHYYLRRRR